MERLPTGIPGLDRITHGGFLKGGLYLVEGMAGTGKTILANQLAFHHARSDGRALVVTLLGESHGKMVEHLRGFAFFDEGRLAESVVYLSGYRSLLDRGLRGLTETLAGAIRGHHPTLLLVDGLRAVRNETEGEGAVARFIHELNTFVGTVGVTTFLLSPTIGNPPLPEHALVDGLVELRVVERGLRHVRELGVHKLRGSGHLDGHHVFTITASAGITIYPRPEAAMSEYAPVARERKERLPFGVTRFDEMLQGGLIAGSITSLVGAPGSGKTILGLKFLEAGAQVGERGLYFGFYETPDRLIGKAEGVGIRLRDAVDAGLIELIWNPPLEDSMDRLGYQLLEAVDGRGVRRLFVDDCEGFRDSSAYPERARRFVTALSNQLRAGGVTTLFSEEAPLFAGAETGRLVSGLSVIAENILLLRYVELKARLHRLISILKVRESGYDCGVREFVIGERGIEVAESSASAAAHLHHAARAVAPAEAGPEPSAGGTGAAGPTPNR